MEFDFKNFSITEIKNFGLNRSEENLNLLLKIFPEVEDIEVKRENVSSIGRQRDDKIIFDFIKNNVYGCGFMDLVYQICIGLAFIKVVPIKIF